MKLLIVGTGAIGTIYGIALSKKNEVTHFVREDKYAAMNEKTIGYDIIDEREHKKNMYTTGKYTYSCVTKIEKDYDLIVVPVNSYQLEDALETLVQQAPNSKYLLFTLNWQGTEKIDKILKKDQYIMGYAGGGGTLKGDLMWGNIGNDVPLGAVYEEQKQLLNSTINLFEASGIIPEIPQNILHWLWIHNVGASPLGVALTKYNDMEKLMNDKKLVKTAFNAMNEGYALCEKRGVNIKDFPECKMFKIPFFVLYPIFKHNVEKNPVMERYMAHALLALEEMKDNFKLMVETGKQMKFNMPNMDQLYRLI